MKKLKNCKLNGKYGIQEFKYVYSIKNIQNFEKSFQVLFNKLIN
jgi:hypothetical protein